MTFIKKKKKNIKCLSIILNIYIFIYFWIIIPLILSYVNWYYYIDCAQWLLKHWFNICILVVFRLFGRTCRLQSLLLMEWKKSCAYIWLRDKRINITETAHWNNSWLAGANSKINQITGICSNNRSVTVTRNGS